MEHVDLLIVGAGVSGLSMAKTFKDLNPHSSLLIFERGSGIGGIWSEERQYPGLKTNNHYGSFEFSDLPMHATDRDTGHIPGRAVNEYMQQYAATFDLIDHVALNTTVLSAEDLGADGWLVTARTASTTLPRRVKAAKLVVASGLLSEPSLPSFAGAESFRGPIVHSSQFAQHSKTWTDHKNVVIFGGAKFSWDVASVFASHDVQVDWVIRTDGHGPCWMAPSKLTPFKISPDVLLSTRMLTWFSPSVWGHADGFQYVRDTLNSTWLGRRLMKGFYSKSGGSVIQENGYDKHPETMKLKPRDDFFFVGTNRGIMNYEHSIMQQVREGRIRVHIADVDHLSPDAVHLTDGNVLPADMIICGTGWKHEPSFKFITTRDLSVPGASSSSSYHAAAAAADAEIFSRFPVLADQPKPTCAAAADTTDTTEPWRLHRFMVPPSTLEHRTLAFAMALRTPLTTLIAQAQSLWISAYFAHALPHLEPSAAAPTPADVQRATAADAVLHARFMRWRYPHGFGAKLPDMWLDSLPYVDLMLGELGLRRWRKPSLWRECTEAYGVRDYVGLVDEWKAHVAWNAPDSDSDAASSEMASDDEEIKTDDAVCSAVQRERIAALAHEVRRRRGLAPHVDAAYNMDHVNRTVVC